MIDFKIDFVERSLENLEKYRGEYEVTNLINYCLSLIVLPKEVCYDEISKKYYNKKIKDVDGLNFSFRGSFKSKGNEIEIKDMYVNSFLRNLRNGVAHCNITLLGDKYDCGKKISSIKIGDKNDDFKCEIEIEDFKSLVVFIAKEYLEIYKNNNCRL